ncbi:hypothetical protein HKCCE2091_10710 [Rhodobacterales bacterium HKCCE2091]|nr:hypothetical protein [Rhodobacterales bacterium HKCCE2091]
MTPTGRTVFVHLFAFVSGIAAACAVVVVLGGLFFGGGPDIDPAEVTMTLVLAALALIAGFAVWTWLVAAFLKLSPGVNWWAGGLASLIGVVATGVFAISQGWVAPFEATVLALLVLFALGGWLSHRPQGGDG